MKKALITGITGQDGSYLAELLLSKGYEVHGIIRRASTFNTHRIDHLYNDPHNKGVRMHLHYGDLSDQGLITELVYNVNPGEIYHLGAQSHVRVSFDMPEYTGNISALGTTRILEAVRRSGIRTKFYQASSSEMFGDAPPRQNERTPLSPRSPYAAAKAYAFWMAVNYRDAYNMFISNGILFNHESPRRGETFVTRKISRGIAQILSGKQGIIYLGNLDAMRDWGFAPEFVEAMWLMLQQEQGEDFVVGTGESHTVREFVEAAFNYVGVEIEWQGKGENEKGVVRSTDLGLAKGLLQGKQVVGIDSKYYRPTEVQHLEADMSKAQSRLQWQPVYRFSDLVKIMVDHDLLDHGITAPGAGAKLMEKRGLRWTMSAVTGRDSVQNDAG
jgi:GDPmannose 4,6-dehydratase